MEKKIYIRYCPDKFHLFLFFVFSFVTTIYSVTPIDVGPYTISSPGSYALSANITGSITIAVSNVSLDLNNHTIAPSPSQSLPVGIQINSGFSNIHIANGIIETINGSGIYGSNSSNICVDKVYVNKCAYGIQFNSCSNSSIAACELTQNVIGISLGSCEYIDVNDCVVQDTISYDNAPYAYFINESSFINVVRCKAINTLAFNDSAEAFYDGDGLYNRYESCYAENTKSMPNNASGNFGTATGIDVGTAQYSVVHACIVNGVYSPQNSTGILAPTDQFFCIISGNIIQNVIGGVDGFGDQAVGLYGNNHYSNNIPNNVIVNNAVFNCTALYSSGIDPNFISSAEDAGILYNIAFQ